MRPFRRTDTLGRAALASAAVLSASMAFAQNTSQSTAASIGTGQAAAVFTLSPATPERWYVFKSQTYRSYCIEILPAPDYAGPAEVTFDVLVGGTVVGGSVNKPFTLVWDPHPGDRGAAWCDAIWPDGAVSVRVLQNGASVGTTTAHQIRVVETTIFTPHFEVDVRRGVDSSILLSNTTSARFGVSVTLFDQAGHTFLSPPQIDFNLDPYGSKEIVLSSLGLTRTAGSIVISHFGAQGAVAADLQIVKHQDRTTVPFRPRETYKD